MQLLNKPVPRYYNGEKAEQLNSVSAKTIINIRISFHPQEALKRPYRFRKHTIQYKLHMKIKTFGYIDLSLIVSLIHITIIIKKSPYLYKFITSCSKVSLFPIALLRILLR